MSSNLQQQAQTASTPSFIAALVLNAAVFGAELLAFSLLRKRFKTIYEPRTFLTPKNKRVAPLPDDFLAWPRAIWDSDPEIVRIQNGLDAYMFLRFLRMMVIILLPIWFVSWAVLLPINGVSPNSGLDGLDRFTFGNVARNETNRYSAHIILAWLFTGYICYILNSELRHFVSARQHHLVDRTHSASAQANTVLVTGIPTKYLSEAALTHLFSHVPGGVKKVWLNRNLKHLPAVYDRLLGACNKLESAENALIQAASKRFRSKNGDGSATQEDVEDNSGVRMVDHLVPRNKRPSHRLPLSFMPFALPLIGKKVDTIEWARAEIVTTNAILDAERRLIDTEEQVGDNGKGNGKGSVNSEYPPLSSAFILFHQQIGAHIAAQSLTHHEPFRMASKYTEVAPADVVWANLGLNPYEARVRSAIGWGITLALVVLWAIPVAFIGIVSNIGALCTTYKWLAWLCHIPKEVLGIIQGILPPVLLAVLMMLLPIVLRLLARFEGVPTQVGIELSLMDRFFLFQVVHGFLIVTLSSGIIAALPGIVKNPSSVPTLLAQKLPSASTFFLTYIILQGLSGTAGGFLTIVPLVLYYVKLFILGSTPRSIYNIRYVLRDVAWGTLWPSITLLVVITLGYSIISPIVNGLACATFVLFYVLYKYLFTWQLAMPPSGDSGGLFFPRAVQHVFVGLYVQQICLCALFFLAQNDKGKQAAVAEGALMVVLVAITAFYNSVVNASYAPLLQALPLTLADRSYGMPKAPEGAVVEKDLGAGADVEEEYEGGGERRGQESGKDGGIGAAPERARAPTPRAVRNSRVDADDDDDESDEGPMAITKAEREGPTDFAHPALRSGQRVIWVAEDVIGVSGVEVRAMRAEGVKATMRGAYMDGEGNVDVVGGPEDEEDKV